MYCFSILHARRQRRANFKDLILLRYICHSSLPANLVGAFTAVDEEKAPTPSTCK